MTIITFYVESAIVDQFFTLFVFFSSGIPKSVVWPRSTLLQDDRRPCALADDHESPVGLQPEVGHRTVGRRGGRNVFGHRRRAKDRTGGADHAQGASGSVDKGKQDKHLHAPSASGEPTNDEYCRWTPSWSSRRTSRPSTMPCKFWSRWSRPVGRSCPEVNARASRSTSWRSSSRPVRTLRVSIRKRLISTNWTWFSFR